MDTTRMPQTPPVLETERLRLRGKTAKDFEAFAAFYQSDRSIYVDGPVARATAWINFAAGVGQWNLFGFGSLVIERISDGEVIGGIGLNYPDHFPEREIGWILYRSEDEGRGFASEAVKRVRAYAFDDLCWPTAVSYIHPDNARSIRLAERLGCERDPNAPGLPNDPALVFRHPGP